VTSWGKQINYIIKKGFIPIFSPLSISLLNLLSLKNDIYRSAIVMVVEENERNTSDQRQLEYHLWRRYD
jgi:hypothetical protein